jgi:hypothetical protein
MTLSLSIPDCIYDSITVNTGLYIWLYHCQYQTVYMTLSLSIPDCIYDSITVNTRLYIWLYHCQYWTVYMTLSLSILDCIYDYITVNTELYIYMSNTAKTCVQLRYFTGSVLFIFLCFCVVLFASFFFVLLKLQCPLLS